MSSGSIQFYSKSRDENAKHLSNFTILDPPLIFRQKEFISVEHAFQASKYLFTEKQELFHDFSKSGRWGMDQPSKIKSKGGKAHMKKEEVELSINDWNRLSTTFMKKILKQRLEVDSRFRSLLEEFAMKNVHLYHFERSSSESFWGGCFPKSDNKVCRGEWKGQNHLGISMMELGRELMDQRCLNVERYEI